MKHKSNVLDQFKKFKEFLENEPDKQNKNLKMDNDMEFSNKDLSTLCQKEGIVKHRNGVAQRKNRTLLM